jgi:TolB-like protein
MTGARLELLGGFRLRSGSGLEVDVRAKKNRALVAILALAPHLEVTRDRLIGLLWSDRADEQARSSLRQALVSLRKDFAALEADPIALNGDRVRLDPKRMSVDVVEFLAASAGDDGSALRAAAALYVGPFLDGFTTSDNALEEWLRDARADLAGRAASVLGSLAGTVAGAERIAVAERLVALEPLREASHLALMQAHIAEGQPPLAIKQYETCRLLLKRELGVEPGDDLQKLRRTLERNSNEPSGAVLLGRKPVIAVLPFENLSGDPGQQFFSDGISEDIIDRLTKYRVLAVIGHHSSFAMRARGADLREIRDKLKADYVLTGNVRRSENRIRIAARLTDAKTEGAIWADHYDRPFADIFALQDDVAAIIASTLMGRVEIDIATRSRTSTPAASPVTTMSFKECGTSGSFHLSPIRLQFSALRRPSTFIPRTPKRINGWRAVITTPGSSSFQGKGYSIAWSTLVVPWSSIRPAPAALQSMVFPNCGWMVLLPRNPIINRRSH